MYDLVFDAEMQDGDQLFEDNGVKVVVDRKVTSTSLALNLIIPADSTARGLFL